MSLFDGMACGMIAFRQLGIPVERYVAYEIDKYAIKTASHNFPEIEQMGDVFNADFTQYKGFDWLIGGSPCTYWSIAQTKNRETTASGMGWELFSQYVRALKEAEPQYFLYENNKSMSKEIRRCISEAFGFEPICINSALVSAQNRQRLYWVGRRNADGSYGKVEIEQPDDRGILLRDVLESGIAWNEKGYALTASYNGAVVWNTLQRHQRSMVAEPVCVNSKSGRNGVEGLQPSLADRIYSLDGKSTAVTTGYLPKVAEPVRIGTIESDTSNADYDSKQYRVYSPDAKSVTLCGQGGGVGAKTGLYAVPIGAAWRGHKNHGCSSSFEVRKDGKSNSVIVGHQNRLVVDTITAAMRVPEATARGYVDIAPGECVDLAQEHSKTRRGRRMAVKSNCLTTSCAFYEYCGRIDQPIYRVEGGMITVNGKQYPIKLRDGCYIIRKLTVRECMRLQTVPEWYVFPVSDTQAYKMLGNGWTVEVIMHLIRAAKGE